VLRITLTHRDFAVYGSTGRKAELGATFIKRLSAFFEKLCVRINVVMEELGVSNDEPGA
jgi:hypothetical protein